MVDRSHPDTAVHAREHFVFPGALLPISEALTEIGHTAYWVGPSLIRLIEGERPVSFALLTDATQAQLTALFASAVPIADSRGTVMIPSPAGPVDATPLRPNGSILDELSHFDFTIHAIAYDAREDALLDPFDGLADLAAGRLRAVRSAADRLSEDPLRGLRAIRLVATRGLKLDPELEFALADTPSGLESIPRIRVREELVATIMAPGVGQAWPLFERAGIAGRLAPNVRTNAGLLIELLPCELALRLSAWLIGARARRALQRLRFSRPIVDRVENLLQLHPIEMRAEPQKPAAVARLARRESARDLNAAVVLRRTELRVEGQGSGDAVDKLERLARALTELREENSRAPRTRLALNGQQVMDQLGCGPGPNVGRALGYLTEHVATHPTHNEPDKLVELLQGWMAAKPEA